MTNPQADPGWYDDPSSPGSQAERYWNGTEWTPRRRPKTPTQLSHPDSLSSGHTNPAADRADPVQWPPTPPPPPPHGPSAARSYPDPADPTRTNIWNGVQWADARQNTGSPGSGSVPYPDASGYQSPQGPAWPPQPPGGIPPFQPPPMAFAPQEKSSAVAVVLTILWPGAGHLYLGLTQKGMPYVVANAIGLAFGLFLFIFLPVTFLIWLITLVMTVGDITQETNVVNEAIRRGQRIQG